MSDLRESGQIEQDADTILMLYRDEIYNENSPMKGIAEVICRKNRQGRIGSVFMSFKGDFCLFEPFNGEIPKAEVVEMKGKRKWN
jgi:replicative DNA helicase